MLSVLLGTSVGSQRNSDNLGDNECPICSELYDSQGDHRMALLNCDHTLCHCCLATILKRAADSSRVQCPLCRQKTPLLHWEIQRMQEDMIASLAVSGPSVFPLAYFSSLDIFYCVFLLFIPSHCSPACCIFMICTWTFSIRLSW
uniref:E3 ubiquitin-protein ligase RNF182 n=1 Tax=Salmo trutta TaxID=8032 RepID=A0A674AFU5_SALTR